MPERRAVTVPSDDVMRAFRVAQPLVRLEGGQGQAYRSGDRILKPAKDDEQTNWIAAFHAQTDCGGFRLPKPVRANDGRYVVDGWQAWMVVEGEHRSGRWGEVVDLCVRFHETISSVSRPDWFDRMPLDNPWTIADKVVWNEREVEHHLPFAPVVDRLRRALRPVDVPSQLIHGDFGGNVLYADGLAPAVIDFSPYWRPAGFAAGVVVADAIVWGDAELSLIERASDRIDDFAQMLVRAELRRILEIEAAHRLWGWDVLGELNDHLPLVDAIVKRCE